MNGSSYVMLLPFLALGVGALILMLQTVFKQISSPRAVLLVLVLTLLSSLVSLLQVNTGHLWEGGLVIDDLTKGLGVLVLCAALMSSFFFVTSVPFCSLFLVGEVAALFVFVVLGLLVSLASYDFITLFIGLEMSALGLYVLIGYLKPSRLSMESGLKYFLMGSVASALMLFGMGFVFLGTGTLYLNEMASHLLTTGVYSVKWLSVGLVLILLAFSFKLALFPFHSWAPDVYESAPTPLVLFMILSIKIVVIGLCLRFAWMMPTYDWGRLMTYLALVSMTFGNVLALVQSSVRRMLAYSSIAHSGYLALGLAGLGSNFHILGLQSVLFYLLSYSLAACVSFGVIHLWEERLGLVNIQMDHIKGMAKASPWLALCLATAIFSFAGLPPTAGFMGKFFVFYHALVQGLTWQVLWAVVMSIVGLYVYLRMMVHMFMHEAHPSWAGVVASKYTAPRGSCSLLGGFALLLWCLGTIGPDKLLQCLHPMAESVSKAPAFSVKQEP